VNIYTATLPVDPKRRLGSRGPNLGRKITIDSDCWIGGGVTILPGRTIGKGSTVGAGSIVTRVRSLSMSFNLASSTSCKISSRLELFANSVSRTFHHTPLFAETQPESFEAFIHLTKDDSHCLLSQHKQPFASISPLLLPTSLFNIPRLLMNDTILSQLSSCLYPVGILFLEGRYFCIALIIYTTGR
jgi:hypothetical protein